MARPVQAGDLDQRVTLQHRITAPDGGGGYETSWSDIGTIWAKVVPLGAVETLTAQQSESRVSYQIWVRWRPDLGADMRLIWRGKTFDIIGVADAGPRVETVRLDCASGGSE
jgi:SPP1 family predicted phage head-tail adaptor